MIKKISWTVIFIGIAAFLAFSCWAKTNIDNRVIFFLILAFLPWIPKNIKSLNALGIFGYELFENNEESNIEKNIKKIKEEKNDEENVIENEIKNIPTYQERFYFVKSKMEKTLNRLASNNAIEEQWPNNNLAQLLNKKGVINDEEYEAIKELWKIFNRAAKKGVHLFNIDEINWVIEKGVVMLEILENKSKYKEEV